MTQERMIRAIRASNIKEHIQQEIVAVIEATRTTPAVSTGELDVLEAEQNSRTEQENFSEE